MRVTRESLLRIAKETAQERAYNDPDIVAAYLTGSLLNVDPMLGGTADIDIVFVHKNQADADPRIRKTHPRFSSRHQPPHKGRIQVAARTAQ